MKTKIDIISENFDLIFEREIESLSQEAKESLPRDIMFKIFRKGGAFDSKSTSRLSFDEKMFVLWKAKKKRLGIWIEDEKVGLSVDQFVDLRQSDRQRDYGIEQAEGMVVPGVMVLAGKELADTFTYLNHLTTGSAYNYLIKGKNNTTHPITKNNREGSYIAKFLANYDGQKKNIVANTGLTIPEFYVLLTLFDGREVISSTIHKEKFRRAYQSTPSKIIRSFKTLQDKGFILKFGVAKGAKLQITPLGKDTISRIFDRYILNC